MKRRRYTSPDRPARPLSKNALARRCEQLAHQRQNLHQGCVKLQYDNAQLKNCLAWMTEQVQKYKGQIDELTAPIFDLAAIHYTPGQDADDSTRLPRWEISGVVDIAIRIDLKRIRCLPQCNKNAYLRTLAEQFGDKARRHALENFQILDAF